VSEPGPALKPEWVAPARTALVVIDAQVDFASADGAMGQAGVDLTAVTAALETANRLATAARSAGAPVLFVALRTGKASGSRAWAERLRRLGEDAEKGLAICRTGERGAEFAGPRPAPGEAVVAKTRYSGFFRTDLESRLREMGMDTIVICGLTTDCCVAATALDAFERDFHVFVASDACAAYEQEVHAGALRILALNCAILVTADEVAAAWRAVSGRER
jgi:nicotinamidase-related amidase